MFATDITLNEFNRAYLSRLMADIREDELDCQPHAELHSVRWILAHLAIAVDYGFAQLGMPFVCPADWHSGYGPTSQAGTAANVKPTQDELLAKIDSGYTQLCSAASAASPSQLEEIHEVGLLKGTPLRTKGDLIAHLLATHFAVHLGQLSTLRRLSGRPMLF